MLRLLCYALAGKYFNLLNLLFFNKPLCERGELILFFLRGYCMTSPVFVVLTCQPDLYAVVDFKISFAGNATGKPCHQLLPYMFNG